MSFLMMCGARFGADVALSMHSDHPRRLRAFNSCLQLLSFSDGLFDVQAHQEYKALFLVHDAALERCFEALL